jgi:integrase
MATILKRNGRRSIQFMDAAGHRKTLALGKVTQKQAEFIKTKVQALAAACITGHAPDDEVSAWLAKRDSIMLDKLAAVGLIERRASATLGSFLDEYTTGRIDVKPATREVWSQPVRNLKQFFGVDRPLRNITAGDAENFRLFLVGEKLSATTVQKRLQFARQFFRSACRHKLIAENPFADVRSNAGNDSDRQRFITQEAAGKLLEACPTLDWRLIVALSRFGGLRCPSEVLSLTWQDIDWENERIIVHSPKTEHHPGKDIRLIPLFPELRSILDEAYEAAPEGAVYLVSEKYRKAAMGPQGWRGCNLRTTMKKIIRRAGMTPWPRLFHNLRSSRETELCERFPIHVVTAWLGNTPEIARKHYLQVTDEHFRQAATPDKLLQSALQPALQQPAADLRTGEKNVGTDETVTSDGQNPKAMPCKGLRTLSKPCDAHLSPCQITTSGEDRIRTCGAVSHPPV